MRHADPATYKLYYCFILLLFFFLIFVQNSFPNIRYLRGLMFFYVEYKYPLTGNCGLLCVGTKLGMVK